MNTHTSHLSILRDRASMLAQARMFFAERNVCEVDCPILSSAASVDAHIDLIATHQDPPYYLHSSPEYGMKRLLQQGMGDVFQISHVFREGECSAKHNPEFTMAEWYRLGISFQDMILETLDFIRLFVGDLPAVQLSYRETFKQFAGLDYVTASNEELVTYLHSRGITPHEEAVKEGKDYLLNLILGMIIEPQLGQHALYALTFYPASQSALAQTRLHGDEPVSERFEIYYKGIELANGYHELADAEEQRSRLLQSNKERLKLGKNELAIDDKFLSALKKGLPDCCGVAVGFDRLMMLRHQAAHISEVIPFDWHHA